MTSEQGPHRFRWFEHGPAWIMAIVAVAGILATLGIIRGADQTPATTPNESAAAPREDDPAEAPTPDQEKPAEPAEVFWSGSLEFPPLNGSGAAFSLDVRPPRYVEGRSVRLDFISDSLYDFEESGIVLAEWPSDSTPDRDKCVSTIDENGSSSTGSLSKGSQVCGTSTEGRTFLIKVKRVVPGDGMYTDVTVWKP